MSRCVLSTCTPHRTTAQETPARTGRYWPCTHARRSNPCITIQIQIVRDHPCRDACLARAPHDAPPHRRRLHVHAGTGLAPRSPDKLPASRFRYSPNARPRPCRDACVARAPHNAPPHRRRLHVHAVTGLAPTPSDKMPASRFRYSPNVRPRPSMLRCVLSTCTPQRTAAHETPARTRRYWPCTHAPR
jgi:hypothetical protein